MKIIKIMSISLCLIALTINVSAFAQSSIMKVKSIEIPEKTVCIKNSSAVDVNKFFSEITTLSFEVFKAGNKEEVAKIISSLRKDTAVENVTEGKLTGDYQAITLILKSVKSKAWFVSEFKKAGLNTVRINNNPIVKVDEM